MCGLLLLSLYWCPNAILGKVVAKFCAKYLHPQVLKSEASSAGDLGVSVQKAFLRYIVYFDSLMFISSCIVDTAVSRFIGSFLVAVKWNNFQYFFLSCRMDEMMRGQRGWRELAVLGDKINKFTGMIEGLIWSPRGSDSNDHEDNWAFEEVILYWTIFFMFSLVLFFL